MKFNLFKNLILIVLIAFSQKAFSQNMSNTTISSCNTIIYDDGGPSGDYTENNYQMTICATSGSNLYIVVQELMLGAAFNGDTDILIIYEGTGTGGTVLFDSQVSSAPSAILTSNDPCITITIETDPSFFSTPVAAGFAILVSCTIPETCNDGILNNGEVMIDCGGPNCVPCYQATSCGPNVITNGDFEQTEPPCATGTDSPSSGQIFIDITNTTNWYGTSQTTGAGSGITPDLYNNNCAGNSTTACFGSPASMGFFTSTGSGGNVREYIQTQLNTSLTAGQEYCITVDVTAGFPGNSDGLGFWFHDQGIIDIDLDNGGNSFLGAGSIVNGTPQAVNPSGNVFTQGTCEQLVLGFCADGDETYLTIGNFNTDANTLPGGTGYLIIDNLVVEEACPPSFNATIVASGTPDCLGSCVDLYAQTSNPAGGCQITNDFTFQWYQDGVLMPGQTNDTLLNVCPTTNTTYSVEITYTAGCSSTTIPESQTTITFNCTGGFNLAVDATPPTICEGACTDLTATPDQPGTYTYSWNEQGNATVLGTTQTINVCPTTTTTYEVTADDGSNSVTGTVTVTVNPLPVAGTNGAVTYCTSDPTDDLFGHLGGSPDAGGTWSPAMTSGTGVFDPSVDPAGTYTYSVTNSCGTVSADVVVTVNPGPDPGLAGATTLCTTDPSVDLFTLLGGTPDAGGSWSPAMTSGTGVFDPSTDPGGVYTYTVTNSCGSASADVTVTVTSNPDPGTNGTVTFCSGDTPDDLFNHLNGTPDPGGTWSPALTSGTGVFDPGVDPAGTYTYSLNACGGGTLTADVVVTVNPAPDPGTAGSTTVCTTDPSVDLFTLLGGTPDAGGTWSPAMTSGTGVFDPSVDPGGVYTYTVTNSCGSASSDVTVTVNNNPNPGTNGAVTFCSGDAPDDLFNHLTGSPDAGGTWSPALTSGMGVFDPSVDAAGTYTYSLNACGGGTLTADVVVTINPSPDPGTAGATTLCANDPSVDLFTLLGGSPDVGGSWSPALTSGTGVFDPSQDAGGIYTYTVTNSCGSASADVTVTITTNPDPGTNGTVTFCSNDAAADLFTFLGGTPDAGGTWSPALTSGTGVFDPSVDAGGTYTYSLNACGGGTLTADVVVTVNPAPNAGTAGSITVCSNDPATDLFNQLGGTPDAGGTWTPALTSGTGSFDPTTDPAGTYTYTVTNSCGSVSADVTVTIDNCDPPTALFNISDSSICLGECITLTDVSSGSIVSWDWDFGGAATPNTSTDQNPTICPDSVGTFTISLTVTNGFGSDTYTSTLIVNEVPTVNAGLDTTIEMNATVTLTAIGTPPGGTYLWDDPSLDCPECSIIDVSPVFTQNYVVIYTTAEGCSATDEVLVTVLFEEAIGVPNGFSPNSDGMNDILFVEGEGITGMQFVIYNRYGNKVFESTNQALGWDGTFNGHPENPGVFAWYLSYTLIDGSSGNQSGNVTLIK